MGKIKFIILCLIAVILPVTWALFVEPNMLVVKKVDLTVPKWHKEFNSLKIVVLSDIHVGSPFINYSKLDTIVKITNKEKPDLIFLLGDYLFQGVIGDNFIKPNLVIDKLGNLKATHGVIAVLGNHDWWYDCKKYLENKKITVLENKAVKINYAGKTLWVAGVGDLWTMPVNITDAIKNIKSNNPIILLSHNPDIFPIVPPGISLTIAGHTHGGQVYVPFMGRIVTPSDYGKRYATGHIVESNRHLFVSSGIGTTILPVRFGTPPEIVVLNIKDK